MMDLAQQYSERIENFRLQLEKTKQKESRLSFLRLGSFLAAFLMFYLLFGASAWLAVVVLTAGLTFFAHTLKQHLATANQRQHLQFLLEINEKELACLYGEFHAYPDGKEYIQKEHPYTSDLDIFGKASVFQYINRTTSKPGSDMLAGWLQQPADTATIAARQEAINELKDLKDWRQQQIAVGYRYSNAATNPQNILNWVGENPVFQNRPGLKILINVLSLLIVIAIAGSFWGLPSGLIALLTLINFAVVYRTMPVINKIHKGISKSVEMLKSYEDTISLIEEQAFRSQKLLGLQQKLVAGQKVSAKIKRLAGILNKLDFRLNIMVSVPLNLFFFWDIRQVYQLENWKKEHQAYLPHWFETMAEFEALSSLANLYGNNPDWAMPTIVANSFRFTADYAAHPLIPKNRRVPNTLEIDSEGKIVLVTGSNMSGKSTFLRTCGTNIVLAMAGAPVCARKFEVSQVLVLTSMRIADSLEENTSSFYAELKRLASIIQTVEQGQKVFLLLDEILRGTNSNDRYIGSVALIRQLVKNNAVGMIATHDLALSELEKELPNNIDNYNFDVKIDNDELFFDYKINKGICKSLNASILMKKMGIKV